MSDLNTIAPVTTLVFLDILSEALLTETAWQGFVGENSNIYYDKYTLWREKKKYYIGWVTHSGKYNFICYRKDPFPFDKLSLLYFKFIPRISSTDPAHMTPVINQVFEDVAKRLKLDFVDFSSIDDLEEASFAIVKAVYLNFFLDMPLDVFLQKFHCGGNVVEQQLEELETIKFELLDNASED